MSTSPEIFLEFCSDTICKEFHTYEAQSQSVGSTANKIIGKGAFAGRAVPLPVAHVIEACTSC